MKAKRRSTKTLPAARDEPSNITSVGDISGGKGFAIGPGAKSFVLEISGLFNFASFLKLISRYGFVLITSLVLQGLATTLWLKYANRFSIPVSILLILACFLETGILAVFLIRTRAEKPRLYFVALTISLVGLTAVSAFQARRILQPVRFPPEAFGVALAQFGEGPDFENTPRSREVSQLVLQQLMKQVQEDPDLAFVQVRPIGLIRTQAEAWADGSRIGADLVIWGQLQQSEDQTILSFSILETPDKVSNPMFARVLPLYEIAATSFFKIGSRQSTEISKGTATISSFTFGLAHFFKWDFVAATRAFDEALAATPSSQADSYHYLIYLYYGLSLQRLRRLEEANQYFGKAIQIHPDDPAPWLARAWGNWIMGREDEAQQDAHMVWDLCSRHIQLKPDSYIAYFDRAQANEILEDWDAALADYQAARAQAPDLFIAYIGIDRILIVQERLPEAVQNTHEAIRLAESKDANPAWAYLYLGHIQEMRGDSAQARSAFEKAVVLAPDVDYMHYRLAQFLENTGEPGDLAASEEAYRASIEWSNNKASAHAELARFYARQARLEAAISEYRAALHYDRQAGATWAELAEIFMRLGRETEAREAYNQAIKFDPENPYSHLFYGDFLYNRGEYESAIRAWQRARQLEPDNCVVLLNIGQAYVLLADQEQAELFYREAYAMEPDKDSSCHEEAAARLAGFAK